jgi:NTE family protein
MRRALVLSGGGIAGAAWMVGLIECLRERGIDLGDADLIVGTSGGARAGVQLAAGALEQVAAVYRRGEAPPATAPVSLDKFVAASMRILSEVQGQEAARRIANLEPLGERLGDPAERRGSSPRTCQCSSGPRSGSRLSPSTPRREAGSCSRPAREWRYSTP